VRGFSISRVQGHGGELEHVDTYRGTTVQMGLSEKVRFEVAVCDYHRQALLPHNAMYVLRGAGLPWFG
jgi:nitrogen regulatory protein PII